MDNVEKYMYERYIQRRIKEGYELNKRLKNKTMIVPSNIKSEYKPILIKVLMSLLKDAKYVKIASEIDKNDEIHELQDSFNELGLREIKLEQNIIDGSIIELTFTDTIGELMDET